MNNNKNIIMKDKMLNTGELKEDFAQLNKQL